ncbi:hypothetical protein WICPIJ_009189 [Wickerhamomyces pijperi]|uniref:Uncharacterized protein n=1 Tax=Wickerhamomyces pijperi TaxID=599730 RepID=A0A9P8PRZ4_WICPI|nr:hypothetical protein WICPIJ_009189 [Wickerhamomyces pijperi]
MSDVLIAIKNFVEGPIDYKSQKKTEDLNFYLLVLGSIIASLIGFITQSIFNLSIAFCVSIAATIIIVVPPYAAYNKEDNLNLPWFQPKAVAVPIIGEEVL